MIDPNVLLRKENMTRAIRPLLGLMLVTCLGAFGCSAALMTVGVLDEPEQNRMFQSQTRIEFEQIAGKAISSRITPTGRVVCHYKYVDGEAGVVGSRDDSFSESRKFDLFASLLFMGVFEPVVTPVTMWERSEATRQIYVIYDSSENIQAICRVSKQNTPLCASELSHEEESTLE
jgi:hypothetical protein